MLISDITYQTKLNTICQIAWNLKNNFENNSFLKQFVFNFRSQNSLQFKGPLQLLSKMAPDGSIMLSIASYMYSYTLQPSQMDVQSCSSEEKGIILDALTNYMKKRQEKKCQLMSKHPHQFCDVLTHVSILESNPAEVTFESTESGQVDTNILVVRQPKQAYYSGPRITCPWCVLMNISRQSTRGSVQHSKVSNV